MKGTVMNFAAGLLAGTVLFGGTAAYGAGVLAERGSCRLLMNGKEVSSEVYQINGRSFVSLEELCNAVGWTVATSETGDSILISSGSPMEESSEESANMEIRDEMIRGGKRCPRRTRPPGSPCQSVPHGRRPGHRLRQAHQT